MRAAICTNIADPHIHTFDGLHYDHFSVGDYVLVESKARNFKVIPLVKDLPFFMHCN